MSHSPAESETKTLYDRAKASMAEEIQRYLRLSDLTDNFSKIPSEGLSDEDIELLTVGVGLSEGASLEQIESESRRKPLVAFRVEESITYGVYKRVRPYLAELYELAESITDGWKSFDPGAIQTHSEVLPALQHVGGIFSKAQLIKKVGGVSDHAISKPAAERLPDHR